MNDQKPNILYVDDELHNLEAFAASFRRYYNIFTANSGKKALEILKEQPIALIITDQRMPEMTGIQFLEGIIAEYPDIIRILLTGYSDVDDVIKAINNAKIFRYITKPWDEQELKQNIDLGIKLYELTTKNRDIIRQMHSESLMQNKTLDLLRKYVPPSVIDGILEKGENNNSLFAGEVRNIAVLFLDIHNLSQLTTEKKPIQVLEHLNNYFKTIVQSVEIHKGMVDKFVGGKILCLFGAPIAYMDNSRNAVYSALNIIDTLKNFNAEYLDKTGCEITIGIAINSGEAVIGNIGSEMHISYTAIGDTVNTASRMVEVTRTLPNSIIVSDSVYKTVKDYIALESLGERKFRGKEKPIGLYKIIENTTN